MASNIETVHGFELEYIVSPPRMKWLLSYKTKHYCHIWRFPDLEGGGGSLIPLKKKFRGVVRISGIGSPLTKAWVGENETVYCCPRESEKGLRWLYKVGRLGPKWRLVPAGLKWDSIPLRERLLDSPGITSLLESAGLIKNPWLISWCWQRRHSGPVDLSTPTIHPPVSSAQTLVGFRSVSVCDGSTARLDGFRSVRRAALPAQKTDEYGTGSPVYTGPVSIRKRVGG
ncbi:hypothetical protein K438DRAFT_1783940 [Mycena galopus ATCC 62051]|nr:hypothetical protein K438DRAFT_1783940 [Mycena galopus ATCC 62051]